MSVISSPLTAALSPSSSPNASSSSAPTTASVSSGSPPAIMVPPSPHGNLHHLEQIRLHQLYTLALADRMRFLQHPLLSAATGGVAYGAGSSSSGSTANGKHEPFRANPEEPKPQQSYIGLISMAILSSKEHKLVLADIYQYILDNYAYFRHRGPGWRNSIRHNLSLNDCFIKAGRAANGKGHYWAIHPACKEDFQRGDYRRRKAQRKVRRHMGLSVEEEDSPSPPPPPQSSSPPQHFLPHWGLFPPPPPPPHFSLHPREPLPSSPPVSTVIQPRKRQFDVASILGSKTPEDEESREEGVVEEDEEDEEGPKPFFPWLAAVDSSHKSHQEYLARYYQLIHNPVSSSNPAIGFPNIPMGSNKNEEEARSGNSSPNNHHPIIEHDSE